AAAAALVVLDVDGVQSGGQADRVLDEGGALEVVVVDDQVAVDGQDAAVVAAGAEGDRHRGRARAGDEYAAEPPTFDVVVVAGDVEVGRPGVVPEAVGRNVREVDRSREDCRGDGRLVAQPVGVAGRGRRDQVLGGTDVEILAEEAGDACGAGAGNDAG